MSMIRLFSAGSLRSALTEFVAEMAPLPEMVFGPAGLLRERIEQGDEPDLFLSANLAHPQALAATRPGVEMQPFARNSLVAVARRELGLTTGNFLDRLLSDGVRIGTSTPLLDPSGDYAQMLFAKADTQRPGAGPILAARARHLVGGRETPPVAYSPADFLVSGEVDLFLGYASNARAMADRFDVVTPPPALAVSADYGLVVLAHDPSRLVQASALVSDLLGPRGRQMLAKHGFLTLA